MKGDEATYSALITAAKEARDQQLAEPSVRRGGGTATLAISGTNCIPLLQANINNVTYQGRRKVNALLSPHSTLERPKHLSYTQY